jgi:hypothetical protein
MSEKILTHRDVPSEKLNPQLSNTNKTKPHQDLYRVRRPPLLIRLACLR